MSIIQNVSAVALIALSLLTVTASKNEGNNSCNSLTDLESALYFTGTNKLKLNKFFYPPRKESVPYAKITYQFQDEDGKISDSEMEKCAVTYVWAVGGFLLIQPPSIFTFSSLFFFHTHQKNYSLVLTLPNKCRSLVNSGNGTCSCANKDNFLDLLSQQIKLYAQFSDPKKVKLGTNMLTQAECYSELDRNYYKSVNTHVYLSYVLCLPLLFITLLIMVVRSLKTSITTKLSNSANHPNVAGLVLTGIFYHLFFLTMDVLAVYNMLVDRELGDLPNANAHERFNFFATWITLSFNLFITMTLLLCSAYLHSKHICGRNKGDCCLFRHIFPRVFSPLFYVIFGDFDMEDFWRKVLDSHQNDSAASKLKRQHITWIVCFMLLSPVFSLASHIGYIFAAWLTEPSKATSVALLFLGVSIYMFLMLRQCYIANKVVEGMQNCSNWCLVCYPFWQWIKCSLNCFYLCCFNKTCPKFTSKVRFNHLNEESRKVNSFFDTQAFCVTFAWGWPLAGTVAFLVSAFYELPIASYLLPIYLLNAFQVFVVMITLLITYKILQITEPEIRTFMRSMKRAYQGRARRPRSRRLVQMDEDDVEATGALVGELVEVVIHELQKSADLPFVTHHQQHTRTTTARASMSQRVARSHSPNEIDEGTQLLTTRLEKSV